MGGMEDSYPSKLQVWRTGAAFLPELPSAAGRPLASPPNPGETADRLFLGETLGPPGRVSRPGEGVEPFTLQWFLEIEHQRHNRHGRWIPRLLEFAKHTGETLLGLGSGLGTDWVQYARHGAKVVVCGPSAEQLALARRNFELRGLEGRFLNTPPTTLPLDSASIDVACVSGLFHELADPRPVVDEVYRVLKPGGKVLAVTPAKYDVDFWQQVLFPWQRWLAPAAATRPTSRGYSRRGLHRLFGQFAEHRVYKRHLRRAEVPHVWRWLPPAFLERLLGRVLVIKAFKPLSAAMHVPPLAA
jgi:SAM-dependent methyltransferase